MFSKRLALPGVALFLVLLAALGAARPSSGAAPEARYLVRAGDTLWSIAHARYDGDLREAVWAIEERNQLDGAAIEPGQVLMLP
jgi:nucleoid-associated protein YgaU